MNIFEFPLYYIGFNQSDEIENHYNEHGFKNVKHFPAVDGRKMSVKKLLNDKLISVRAYRDIVAGGPHQFSGISGKGVIGCTLSHYELWVKCIDNNWPYIIITEEDNRFDRPFTEYDIQMISNAILKPSGVFVSSKLNKDTDRGEGIEFAGTHFCVLTNQACRQLVDRAFPIDVPVDHYLFHMANLKRISISGYHLSKRNTDFWNSSTRGAICIKCILPTNVWYYVMFTVSLMIVSIIMWKLLKAN